MEEIGQSKLPVQAQDAPRGVFRVSVDDKGRLKLPASIVQYLENLGERKVFITTLDEAEARIYPLSVWRETEKMLREPGEDFDDRNDIALIAANYGQDADIDAQGRVTMPADLRKILGLEGEEVRVHCFQGRINVLRSSEYDRRVEAAKVGLTEKLKAQQKKGL
ncbi:MAG: division/cell wall cluster transcriptional repressor MraZ [Bryobacteraceae bacterium]